MRRFLAIFVVGALALVGAACDNDGDDNEAESDDESTEVVENGDDANGDDSEGEGDANGSVAPGAEEFCALVTDLESQNPDDVPTDAELAALIEAAPDEIEADVAELVRLVRDHGDDPEYEPTDEEFTVLNRYGEWVEANCDLGPEPE